MLTIFSHPIVLSLTHKLSFMFAIIYMVAFGLNFTTEELLIYLSLSIVVVFGIGGIGYFLNDLTDIEPDRIAGKRNMFLLFSKTTIGLIGIGCLIFTILPWLLFPFTIISLFFICLEIGLFAIYSFKPFRLKEKGWAGLVADALYAHVIPVMFAVYTFTLIKNPLFNLEFCHITGVLWVFLTGTRNILKHQIEDFDNDQKSNTKTLLQSMNLNRVRKNVVTILIPLEISLFIITLIAINQLNIILVGIFLIYTTLYFIKRKDEIWKNSIIDINSLFYFLAERVLNEFYERWLGLLTIIIFIIYFNEINYLAILAFHVLLFHRILLAK